ncbi:MAG: RpiB/LacA/LacB family sugar-phosphate isomerase [Acidobacteriota bacterium]
MATLRFHLIAEAEARQIPEGATVELEPGGHVTPLARDTLAARRITVVPAGTTDAAIPDDLAPACPVTRVAIAGDHTSLPLKTALVRHLRSQGVAVDDLGSDSTDPVDYPDLAIRVGRAVARREVDGGIVIDGSGLGSAMAANKVRGVRAAMCSTPTLARYAREHIGANVLTLGATLLTPDDAIAIVDVWRTTAMREPRYLRRLLKVQRAEEGR